MSTSLSELLGHDDFVGRHIGPRPDDLVHMLATIGVESVDQLIDTTVPASIRLDRALQLGEAAFGVRRARIAA